VTLAFDRWGDPGHAESFETLVSQAASFAFHLIHAGTELQLITDEWEGTDLDAILEYLALVEMSSSAETPPSPEGALRLSLRS
jgi:hypothetical protein